MIFEACAQTPTCEKPVKTYGFLRFFLGRVFCEKVSDVEGESMKKTIKSVVGGFKITSRSGQDRPATGHCKVTGQGSQTNVPKKLLDYPATAQDPSRDARSSGFSRIRPKTPKGKQEQQHCKHLKVILIMSFQNMLKEEIY